jgi:hypothetical protein
MKAQEIAEFLCRTCYAWLLQECIVGPVKPVPAARAKDIVVNPPLIGRHRFGLQGRYARH